MFFVDEFYSDDGFRRIYGNGFADGSVRALPYSFTDKTEGQVRGEWGDLTLCICQSKDLSSDKDGCVLCLMRLPHGCGLRTCDDLLQAAQTPLCLSAAMIARK
jgi:hypothetical protein